MTRPSVERRKLGTCNALAGSVRRSFTVQRARVGGLRFPYYRAKAKPTSKRRTS